MTWWSSGSAAREPALALLHALAHLGLLRGVQAVVEVRQGVDHLGAAHLHHTGLFVEQVQGTGGINSRGKGDGVRAMLKPLPFVAKISEI